MRTHQHGDGAAPHVRRPIAILLSRFPLITETFILREIEQLERLGQPVVLIPMIEEHPKVVHDEAKPWVNRAVTTPFFSARIARVFLRTWWQKPGRMFDLLSWIVRKSLFHPRTLLKSLMLFPKSVYLASMIRRSKIAHLHAHFATHPTTMAFIIASLSEVSYSFTVHAHDIFVERVLLREKIRDAAFIRSISQFNTRFLENLYPREATGKIEVVHVGIEPERYRREDELFAHTTPVRVLTIAAMKPYKGIPFLIEACGILESQGVDFELEIIGTGPQMNQVRDSITRLGLADRVRLRGALPQDRVAERIAQADIFVLPSVIASTGQMEGIPVALMEAMAAGKAVISTSISGIPELIEHGTSGLLVDPANPDQLAEAMMRLIRDPELRSRLASSARIKVEREFDLHESVGSLLSLFDRFNPPIEEISSLPDIGRDVAWGLRETHERSDSRVFEMLIADAGTKQEVVVKHQVARSGESRAPDVRARDELDLLRRLTRHFSNVVAEQLDTGVPEPLGSDPETGAIVMSRAGGSTIEESIRKARRGGSDHRARLMREIRTAGRWLSHFQSFETGDGGEAVAAVAETARAALR
ncbi:MAG: glycosyltransferase, partial [Thermoanaerobaculia bacterium]|nr:glycosyltransferase [Thermoanaerobaculia bacterium]